MWLITEQRVRFVRIYTENDIVHHLCPSQCVTNENQHRVCPQPSRPIRHLAGILLSLKGHSPLTVLLYQQGIVESRGHPKCPS